ICCMPPAPIFYAVWDRGKKRQEVISERSRLSLMTANAVFSNVAFGKFRTETTAHRRNNVAISSLSPVIDRRYSYDQRGGIVNGYLRGILLGIASFVLGVAVTRYYDTHRITPQRVEPAKPAAKSATAAAENKTVVDYETLDYAHQPLWAYGFDTSRAPGEKAVPQNPPNRNLRPNEDPAEQTRLRRLEGSDATYS